MFVLTLRRGNGAGQEHGKENCHHHHLGIHLSANQRVNNSPRVSTASLPFFFSFDRYLLIVQIEKYGGTLDLFLDTSKAND